MECEIPLIENKSRKRYDDSDSAFLVSFGWER